MLYLEVMILKTKKVQAPVLTDKLKPYDMEGDPLSIASEPLALYQATSLLQSLQPISDRSSTDAESNYSKAILARKGLPKSAAIKIQKMLHLTSKEITALLSISHRTFQRKGSSDLLDKYSTEQLIEITEVISHATEILGDSESVVEWLNIALVGLGGQTPIDLLDNTFGIRVLRDALGKLEHGIFA